MEDENTHTHTHGIEKENKKKKKQRRPIGCIQHSAKNTEQQWNVEAAKKKLEKSEEYVGRLNGSTGRVSVSVSIYCCMDTSMYGMIAKVCALYCLFVLYGE